MYSNKRHTTKKRLLREEPLSIWFMKLIEQLAKADSLRRTNACACATLRASISVDYVLFSTLRDSLNGALTCACTTRDTVVSNYICHSSKNV